MKQKKAMKARLVWSNGHFAQGGQVFVDSPTDFSGYFLLPADAASVEKMREQVGEEVYRFMAGNHAMPFTKLKAPIKEYYRFRADCALKALGLLPPSPKK